MKEYNFKVIENAVGKRLDTYVSSLNSAFTRNSIQRLIKEGNVLVNDKQEKESYKVKLNDKIYLKMDDPEPTNVVAQDIPLDIVYEDDYIIVVNKPKGMVVHPGNGNEDGTLVNAVLAHAKGSLSGIGGKIRPGIVHRLDKDTSGLIIVAKNDFAHVNISNQIKAHTVKKIYTTLVKGNIEEDEATIDMPIGRDTRDRKKMATIEGGKEAVTHFKVLKRYGDYTLLRVKIDTGRTHQIRVHMAKIHHPVVGDEVYSNGKNEFGIHGQLLHSTELDFVHPRTGKLLHFEAPIPEEFENVLKRLDER